MSFRYRPTAYALEILTTLQQQALTDYGLRYPGAEKLKRGMESAAFLAEDMKSIPQSDLAVWRRGREAELSRLQGITTVTSLQDPIDQMIINQVSQEAERRVSRFQNLAVPERAILASLPIGQMNAITVHVPETGEYLVLFQKGLFGLLHLLARLVASVWPRSPNGTGMSLLAKRDEIASGIKDLNDPGGYLAEVLKQSLVAGDPHGMPVLPMSVDRSGMKEAILLNAEVFVLAHEFGHIEHAHFEPDRMINATSGNSALSIASRTQQQEFAADLTGIEYAIGFGVAEPTEIYLGYCGACFFLSCQELVEDALHTLAGENSARYARDTHPAASLRRNALTNILRHRIGNEEASFTAAAYNEMHWALHEIWRLAKPRWLELCKGGVRAHAVWAHAVECQERPVETEIFKEDPPDSTTRQLGMPNLRDMEAYKGESFLALLHLADEKSSARVQAAEWAKRNPHVLVFSLISELAYGKPERREAFFSHLLATGPRLNHWISHLRFVVDRYDGNEDLAGVPEILLEIGVGMEYLIRLSDKVIKGEEIDQERLLFEILSEKMGETFRENRARPG